MPSFNNPVELISCPHLGVFFVSGADTHTFLQSQLTQDMQTVSPSQAALAGFCTAQGRLWASMLLTGNENGAVVGVAYADLMDSFLKRLRMFVLRSKVTIESDTQTKVYGLTLSETDLDALGQCCEVSASLEPLTAWQAQRTPFGQLIAMPSAQAGLARFHLLANDEEFAGLCQAIGNQCHPIDDVTAWRQQDIEAGIGWIEAATQDLFIAQTLNLDLLGGVSFSKGCYPGQEVVARAHYRGTVKRRMHIAKLQTAQNDLVAGTDIFEATEPDNPIGRLISVVARADQTWVLFEAPFKALAGEPLRAGSADGPQLHVQPLPYSLEYVST